MVGKLGIVVVGVVVAGVVAGCGGTTRGVATAPGDVMPITTTSKAPKRTTTKTPTPAADAPGVSPQALAEVRAAGIDGSDSAIADQLSMACIMGESSFNDSRQDVVDVLVQMGSELPPDALRTIVDVAIKYECPDLAADLGG